MIVGALSSILGTRSADKRRFEREDQRRFEDDIRKLHLQIYQASVPFCRAESLEWNTPEEREDRLGTLHASLRTLEDAQVQLMAIRS